MIEVTLESTLKSVEKAEDLAREACAKAGFSEDDQHRVGMAVHESMINAILHGNKNDASKRVVLKIQVHPDRLEIRIRDQGTGFEPKSVRDPLEAENLLKVSGRGIFLIRTFVDEFRVRKAEGAGTEVTLVKRKYPNDRRSELGG